MIPKLPRHPARDELAEDAKLARIKAIALTLERNKGRDLRILQTRWTGARDRLIPFVR